MGFPHRGLDRRKVAPKLKPSSVGPDRVAQIGSGPDGIGEGTSGQGWEELLLE